MHRLEKTEEVGRVLAELPEPALFAVDESLSELNAAASALFGLPQERMVGRPLFDFFEPPDAERLRQGYWGQVFGADGEARHTVRLVRPDGPSRLVELELRSWAPRRVLVLVRDLVARRDARALPTALSQVVARVQRERSVQGVFQALGEELAELCFVTTVLRLETPDLFRYVQISGPRPLMEELQPILGHDVLGRQIPVHSVHLAARAIAERRTYFEHDIPRFIRGRFPWLKAEECARVAEATNEARFTRGVLSPLYVEGQPWGVITICGTGLSPTDLNVLSLFASQLSSALEVAQSIEGLERQNRELAALHAISTSGVAPDGGPVSPLLVRILAEATGSDHCSLHLWESDRSELVLAGSHGEPPAPAGQGLLALEPGGRAAPGQLVYPLSSGGRPLGVLVFGRSGRSYSEEDGRSAQLLAGQLTTRLDNVRLHQEQRRRIEELTLMNEVGSLLSETLDVSGVLQAAMPRVERITGVHCAMVFLLTADEQAMRLAASNRDEAWGLPRLVPLTTPSLSAEAMRERRPLMSDRAMEDPRTLRAYTRHFNLHSELAVPLLVHGRPRGSLVLGKNQPGSHFTPAEVERAVAISHLLGSALANARVHESEQRRTEELRLFLDVSRVVAAAVDVAPVLGAACQSLAKVVDTTDAFIWLLRDGVELEGLAASAQDARAKFEGARVPLTESSVAALALTEGAPVRVPHAQEQRDLDRLLHGQLGLKSTLGLPLLVRNQAVGAVVVGDRHARREWTASELERATAMAGQVAVAVTHVHLYEDLRRSYHALEKAQEELVKRERLAALGELSAVLAHEIRNPLGVIFNALTSLQKLIRPEGDPQLLLQMIGEEADRLNRMVADLLDFARPYEPNRQPVAVGELLEGALEAARRIASPELGPVQIRLELASELPSPAWDAQLMRQALLNLILNALQAMGQEGGRLTLSARPEGLGADNGLRVMVEDTGPGIPPHVGQRIFQPFFTTKATGTGLGLSVVKRIVEAHRGEVAVEAVTPRGTRFVMRLPA